MNRHKRMAWIVVAVGLVAGGAVRADQEIWWGGEGKSLAATGTLLGRAEHWAWFNAGPKYTREYTDGFATLRPGLAFRYTRWGAVAEGQATALQGLPAKGVAPAPKAALGTGAVYFQNVLRTKVNRVYLKNLYAENTDLLGPWVNTIRVRGGRLPYADGIEVPAGEPKLDWLKKARVSERLLGPFGWSAFQRSFDGVDTALTQGWGGVAAFAAHPTQGGFEERGGVTMNGIELLASSVTLTPGLGIPHTAARGFYLGYWDRRPVTQRVDNVKATAKAVNLEIHSFGGDLEGAYPLPGGELDLLAWGVAQRGNWYELDQQAFAGVAEAGFQFSDLWGKPHLRGGGSYGSGDRNVKDSLHETFFQVLPTARKFALAPFYNMMNNRDVFVQAIVKPVVTWTFRADWHWLSLEHPQDRWYVGAGATQERGAIFGYAGRASGGKTDMGQLADLSVMWAAGPHMTVQAYAGRIFSGSVEKGIYNDTSGGYGYLETELKW